MSRREAALEPLAGAPPPSAPPPSSEAPTAGAPPGALDAQTLWRVVRPRLWRILGLAFAVALFAALVAASLEPVYQSTTTLLIDTDRRGFSPVQDSPADNWYSYLSGQTYLQTQVLLLQSKALAEHVAERLGLWTNPELDPRQEPPRRARLRLSPPALVGDWLGGGKASAPISETQARRAVVDAVGGGIKAEVVPDSHIVRLSFRAHDPELAARVAAAYADAYVELGLETRLETVKKAGAWLTERLEGLRKQVESSERELQRYREAQGLVDMGGETDLTDKELADLSARLVEARAKREGLGNEYEQIRKLASLDNAQLASHSVVIRNPLIQTLKTEEMGAERAVSELGERYGARHPKMVAARSDLATVQARLRAEIGNTVAGVKKDYDIATARVSQLEQELAALKLRAQEGNRKEFALRALQRNVETNRQLYDMFLKRFKETDLGADVESTNARVIDVAEVPASPIEPRKMRIILASTLLALVLGIGLALLEERLDNTLKGADDLETHTGLATLGTVPLRRGRRQARSMPERVLLDDPNSDFAEAIRTVRTGVVLSGLDSAHRTVLVTSTVPGEGKTTIAANLALALGQLGRVLLVDGDLRRSSIGIKLGLPADALGLSDLVAGTATLDDCIHRVPNTGLDVLAAGTRPPNPLELLSSARFAQTLSDLEQRYDRLVVDSAPAQAVSDALILSRMCSAVVFVVKADATPRDLVQLALRRLRRTDAPLIGAVLNQIDIARADRYAGYGRYRRYSNAYQGYSRNYGDTGKGA